MKEKSEFEETQETFDGNQLIKNETWVLTCPKERFVEYCKDYPNFHLYLI